MLPFILGTLRCEAVVADILDKGSGVLILVDGNSIIVLRKNVVFSIFKKAR